MKKTLILFAALFLACVLTCRNPFLPPSGTYTTGVPLQSTPAGVMQQFQNAYNQINYSLYVGLLPSDGSFKFYVAPGFVAANPVSLTQEPRDSTMQFTGNSSSYFYWTQDIELSSQKALFNNASFIQFNPDDPFDVAIYPKLDSLGDTIQCEAVMTGELDMFFNDPDAYPNQAIEINSDFLIKRDPNNKKLWVIVKWYDLGGSS
jgi:hypothetical protein